MSLGGAAMARVGDMRPGVTAMSVVPLMRNDLVIEDHGNVWSNKPL
jgi:hypothetical protein